MTKSHLPTTEAAVAAVRRIADERGLTCSVSDDIGADQTSRRTSATPFTALDPDGTLPHEALVELGGSPRVSVRLFPEGDAKITVESVEFDDVPRDSVPGFLESVYGGLAHVRRRPFPPGRWLVVPLPGDETYKEMIMRTALSPWLAHRTRG